ncbi:ribonuclease P protein subunit [Candidatus Micrarchaeota archaeon]|nr:ribonuclease P protein subunit [Candidatus Micrarchaeota archaeon]
MIMVRKEILHEFIGKEMRVVKSNSTAFLRLRGRIIDETKNTFIITTQDNRRIRIPKNACVFEIRFGPKWIRVIGKDIMYRPEDRTKM